MKKLPKILLVFLMSISLVGCGKKEPKEPVVATPAVDVVEVNTFKIIVDAIDEDPLMKLLNTFKTRVEKEHSDTILIEIYKASEVLVDKSIKQALKDNEYDIGIIGSDEFMLDSPWLTMLNSWFLFTDYEHFTKVWSDKVGVAMMSELKTQSGLNVVKTLFEDTKIINAMIETPLKELEDFNVLNTGVKANEADILQMQTLGANVIPIVPKDLYRNLVEGRINAYDDYLLSVKGERLYEMSKTIALTNHQYGFSFLVVNSEKMKKLSEEEAVVFEEALEQFRSDYDQIKMEQRESDLTFFKEFGLDIQSVDRLAFHELFSTFYRSNPSYTTLWNIEHYERILKISIYLQQVKEEALADAIATPAITTKN